MPRVADVHNKIVSYVREYYEEHGYSPTVREIQDFVGYRSSSTTQGHIQALISEGRLRRSPSNPRTLVVVTHEPPRDTVNARVVEEVEGEAEILEYNGKLFYARK